MADTRGIADLIPEPFWQVSYNGNCLPDADDRFDLGGGANCQRFAYAVLAHFGLMVPGLRSSELWEDRHWTAVTNRIRPLDLVLFNRARTPWGAHVAVCVARNRLIHLCRSVGRPAVWSVREFLGHPEYRHLIGAKRVLARDGR